MFRSIDPFDHAFVPLSNRVADEGNEFGDVLPFRSLLAVPDGERLILRDPNIVTLLDARITAGETHWRNHAIKVAMYYGTKASRRVLVPPSQDWPSWSSFAQPAVSSLRLRMYDSPIIRNYFSLAPDQVFTQFFPEIITLSAAPETGSDCVFVGSWQGHTDTRRVNAAGEISTITTSGIAWLQVNAHFSNATRFAERDHNWSDLLRYRLYVVSHFVENPFFVEFPARGITPGQAGLLYSTWQFLQAQPPLGLWVPDIDDPSQPRILSLSNRRLIKYTATYTTPSGPGTGTGTGAGAGSGGTAQDPQPAPVLNPWQRQLFNFASPDFSFASGAQFSILPGI